MMRAFCIAVAVAVGPLQAQTVAITGGRVYTVSGAPVENGTVLIQGGRIIQVGANVPVPADAQRIDAAGRWVTPGFINSSTQLGLVEIGLEGATRDVSARGTNSIAAAFTVWDGFNPASVLLAPARSEGVTTVVIAPSGGLVAGQAAVLDLVDGSLTEMMVRAPVGMVAQITNSLSTVGARAESIVKLRELLEDTRAYSRRRTEFERAATRDFAAGRLDLDAMIPVLEGRLPLIVVANRASDIEAVLKLARDYNVRVAIGGGAEAWMVADRLAAARVPVLTGAMNNIPSSFSTLGSYQESAAILRRAGVDVILIGDSGVSDAETYNVRNIKQEAGNAVAYGMSWDDALRAVTIAPARFLGIANDYGTLESGKIANVVIWSGDPFEFSTRAERVFVRGREIAAPNRQRMLEERYRTLPPDYRKP